MDYSGQSCERIYTLSAAAPPLASKLNDDILKRLADTSVSRRLKQGEIPYCQGSLAKRFFVVNEGPCKLYRTSPEGEEKILAQAEPDDTMSEIIAFMDIPRYPVYAQAMERSSGTGFLSDVYREGLIESTKASLGFMKHQTNRILELIDEIESLALFDGRTRVIPYLLHLMPKADFCTNIITIPLPINNNMISAQLPIHPETLSRILTELVKRELIRRTSDPHKLEISEPDLLRQALNESIKAE